MQRRVCKALPERKPESDSTSKRLLRKPVNYRTYRQEDRSATYDRTKSKNLNKTPKHITVQTKSQIYDPFHAISGSGFLRNLKLACDTDGKYEKAELWIFNFVLKNSIFASLNTRMKGNKELSKWYPEREKQKLWRFFQKIMN